MSEEPELVEETICTQYGKPTAVIQVLWYGDEFVDIMITFEDIGVTEIETMRVSQYKRISDLCRKFRLGKEKR